MLYAQGIELPKMNPLEAYKIVGTAWFVVDVLFFLALVLIGVFSVVIIVALADKGKVVESYFEAASLTLSARRTIRITSVTTVLLLLSIGSAFALNSLSLSGSSAQGVMLLDHYNAHIPEGTSVKLPSMEKPTTIESLLVTQEGARTVNYKNIHVVMDNDGLVSLNVNKGTEDKPSLVPLDQVSQ